MVAEAPGPPTAAVDSAALARRIAVGDETAFAAFYASWFAAALSVARAFSRRDEAFCLDVVQQVMLTVARKMPALRDDAAVRAWMVRTVSRAVTDGLRQEQRRQRREGAAAVGDGVAAEPWQHVVAAERRQWLAGCLDGLPAADQALVQARFGETTSVAAAGAEFGLGEDAAHGRLRRVLDKLRQRAAEWFG